MRTLLLCRGSVSLRYSNPLLPGLDPTFHELVNNVIEVWIAIPFDMICKGSQHRPWLYNCHGYAQIRLSVSRLYRRAFHGSLHVTVPFMFIIHRNLTVMIDLSSE